LTPGRARNTLTGLPGKGSVGHGSGMLLASAATNIERALVTAADCEAYEREHPGAASRYRSPCSCSAPVAVVAIAARHGVSQELVRKLRNIARRVPADLLEALRPHAPGMVPLESLGRLTEERQRAIVKLVTEGKATLVQALRDSGW
jgi:hypothetical protein